MNKSYTREDLERFQSVYTYIKLRFTDILALYDNVDPIHRINSMVVEDVTDFYVFCAAYLENGEHEYCTIPILDFFDNDALMQSLELRREKRLARIERQKREQAEREQATLDFERKRYERLKARYGQE